MPDKFKLPTFDNVPERRPRPSFGELLESSKLSRIPRTPTRDAMPPTCSNCPKRLDVSDEYQTAIGFCKTCLKTYAVVGVGVEKYAESKIRRNYLGGK